ncbi:MAG: hypothetical protein IIZ93_14475, partial [Acidaminococcaceae bacterium]|nr:hypothetical protein [Acidaminococcaceae bacterium]
CGNQKQYITQQCINQCIPVIVFRKRGNTCKKQPDMILFPKVNGACNYNKKQQNANTSSIMIPIHTDTCLILLTE